MIAGKRCGHEAHREECLLCRIAARAPAVIAAASAPGRKLSIAEHYTCTKRGTEPVGESRCAEGCDRSVMVPLFACEVHGQCSVLKRTEAKARDCVRCTSRVPLPGMPDGYKEEKARLAAKREAEARARAKEKPAAPGVWAVGLTCVPERLATTLPRTVESLVAAGFPRPRLFVDGGDGVGPEWGALACEITPRPRRIGAFGNWLLAAWELSVRHPHAGRYLIAQDDVIFCLGVREYLDRVAWPRNALINLYTSHWHKFPAGGPAGWLPALTPGMGALAYAFTRDALRAVLTRPGMFDAPARPGRKGTHGVDTKVAGAAGAAGYREHVHRPSLVQHTGARDSVLKNGNSGSRVSPDFRGEGFDARSLLPPARTKGGAMSAAHRARVAAEVAHRAPCRVLVFGAGDDTAGYVRANPGGRVLVVERDPAWARAARETGAEASTAPPAGPWDVILVDGPRGDGRRGLAYRHAAASVAPGGVILAHDVDRPGDRADALAALGEPAEVVPGPPDLGVWPGPPPGR